MKKSTIIILKIIIVLIGLVVIAGLIRFPQTEGRAANLNLINIYTDPIIIYIYIASIPFFGILYNAFKLLNLSETKKSFSKSALNALKNLKFCAQTLIGFMTAAVLYIFIMAKNTNEDPVGFLTVGAILIFISAVIAYSANKLQERLK